VLATALRTIVLVGSVAVSGCIHSTKAPGAAGNCADIQGLPLGNLLLFGEMHGSVETPALISQLACSLSSSRELAIGLEIPSGEQSLLDSYLASRGAKTDVQKLTGSDFWQRGRDGRSSSAMLRLIEDIRKLKEGGAPVNLFAFDDQPGTTLERDIAVANGIRRFHDSHPNTQIIALMGNIHAMQEPIAIEDHTIVPSGKLLKDLDPVSILVAYPKGTVWACMPDCGIHEVSAAKSFAGAPGFSRGALSAGYSHTFSLRSITAAPPAVQE
jgi:hypothetical protein